MVLFISDTTECRRLARRVVIGDFSDAQIIEWQKKYYSYIRTMTDKDDWASTDREFGALQIIETEMVAGEIIKHYGDTDTAIIGRNMIADAKADLKDNVISNMDTEVGETEFEIDRTEFKGWGLNANASPPNRLEWSSQSTDNETF